MQKTECLGLNKPEKGEFYKVDTMNENMEVIDKAVAELKKGKTIIFTNVSVPADLFTEDATYTKYPYKADIPCEGITSDYVPDVTFDVAEATSGVYAPICITGDGSVSIFATEIPADSIVIPVIKCEREKI